MLSRRRRRLEAWPQAWGRPHGSRRFAPHHEGGSRAAPDSTSLLQSDQRAGMNRRELITLIGGAAAAWPFAARAQQAGKLPTIGFLGASTAAAWSHRVAAFEQRLHQLGWNEGRTIAIEYRWAEGRNERSAEIAAEFVRLKVDV